MNGVQLITQSEYARRRGVAKSAVAKAVSERRITLIDGKVDPVVADIQWERNTRARADGGRSTTAVTAPGSAGSGSASANGSASDHADPVAPPASLAADPGYAKFRARREEADAQIAEMNAAKMRGALLLREDVDRAMFEIGRELRDRLTGCARRIASEVAAVATAEGCEDVIDREHRIVLELLVTSLREKIGAPVRPQPPQQHQEAAA